MASTDSMSKGDKLVAAAFAVSSVTSIFSSYTAPVNDLKRDAASHQSGNDTQRAAIVSAAVVSGVSLLAKSPAVFLLGAGMIMIETWVRHHATYTMPKTSH